LIGSKLIKALEQAENEDIPTLNTRYPSLASIITATGVTIPDSTWARMPSLHSELQSEREVDHDGGMELDEDLVRLPNSSIADI
jgi:hypothetical protein